MPQFQDALRQRARKLGWHGGRRRDQRGQGRAMRTCAHPVDRPDARRERRGGQRTPA